MLLKLVEKKQEASDVVTFIFQPEAKLSMKAGQFLHYILPHDNPDDRGVERWFTNAAAPFEGHVQITTRFALGRSSTFKAALKNLNVGDTIEADNPEGDFTVEDPSRELVFLAGGIGITPFRAILKQLDHEGAKPKVTLIYANRNREVVFKQELEKLQINNPNLKIDYITSPQRIDKELLSGYVTSFPQAIFYVSGPEPMVEALGADLRSLGLEEGQIKQDWFPGYQAE